MHRKAYKLTANIFLFVVLMLMFVIPLSTVTIANVSNQNVLSAQDKREFIQKPKSQILKENAQHMDEETEEENENDLMDYRP